MYIGTELCQPAINQLNVTDVSLQVALEICRQSITFPKVVNVIYRESSLLRYYAHYFGLRCKNYLLHPEQKIKKSKASR